MGGGIESSKAGAGLSRSVAPLNKLLAAGRQFSFVCVHPLFFSGVCTLSQGQTTE